MGLPYVKYGRTRSGLNCWGLCRLIYKERLTIELDDLSPHYSAVYAEHVGIGSAATPEAHPSGGPGRQRHVF